MQHRIHDCFISQSENGGMKMEHNANGTIAMNEESHESDPSDGSRLRM